jgi:hypothetical protein
VNENCTILVRGGISQIDKSRLNEIVLTVPDRYKISKTTLYGILDFKGKPTLTERPNDLWWNVRTSSVFCKVNHEAIIDVIRRFCENIRHGFLNVCSGSDVRLIPDSDPCSRVKNTLREFLQEDDFNSSVIFDTFALLITLLFELFGTDDFEHKKSIATRMIILLDKMYIYFSSADFMHLVGVNHNELEKLKHIYPHMFPFFGLEYRIFIRYLYSFIHGVDVSRNVYQLMTCYMNDVITFMHTHRSNPDFIRSLVTVTKDNEVECMFGGDERLKQEWFRLMIQTLLIWMNQALTYHLNESVIYELNRVINVVARELDIRELGIRELDDTLLDALLDALNNFGREAPVDDGNYITYRSLKNQQIEIFGPIEFAVDEKDAQGEEAPEEETPEEDAQKEDPQGEEAPEGDAQGEERITGLGETK